MGKGIVAVIVALVVVAIVFVLVMKKGNAPKNQKKGRKEGGGPLRPEKDEIPAKPIVPADGALGEKAREKRGNSQGFKESPAADEERKTAPKPDRKERTNDTGGAGKTAADCREADKEAYRQKAEKNAAKKEVYYYLSQSLKMMYEYDKEDRWEELLKLEQPSKKLLECCEAVTEELPGEQKALLQKLFACIDMKGETETGAGTVTDSRGLEEVFLSMLLPFYPYYKRELSEFRYNTLLNQDALELFHRLTGKRYRPGYRNRYTTGVTAFLWKGNRYKIYNPAGILLCDAVFEEGKLKEGYAVFRTDESEDSDWSILKKGYYKDGRFTEEAICYTYKKPCC